LTDRYWRKGPRKEFTLLDARNTLKSHVSDERIQGKPRKAKLRSKGKPNEPGRNPIESKEFQIAGLAAGTRRTSPARPRKAAGARRGIGDSVQSQDAQEATFHAVSDQYRL
jgi:hypothetical protein